MNLWMPWWNLVQRLRPACARKRTFMWMVVVLIGFIIRPDLLGVTSIVRAIGLAEACYDRLLDFFHSPAVVIDRLTSTWADVVLSSFPLVRFNGRVILVGDGIKTAKSGKKMPGVKKAKSYPLETVRYESASAHLPWYTVSDFTCDY